MVRQEAVCWSISLISSIFSWLSPHVCAAGRSLSKILQFQRAPMKSIEVANEASPLYSWLVTFFILLAGSHQENSLSCSLVVFSLHFGLQQWWTSLRSQHSVFWSIITAGWEFSEGTEWWRDLRLDLVNSRGGFQPLLQAGLSASLDQVSVVVSLSSIIGGNRFSFWRGRTFGIVPCGILVCFTVFSSMQCISALSFINQFFSILANLAHSCPQSCWSVTCPSLPCTNS